MAVRQHEAVTVSPSRMRGVVFEEIVPEDFGDVGHAHGHAGVTRIRLLHGIHRKRSDGIGERTSWQLRSGAGRLRMSHGHQESSLQGIDAGRGRDSVAARLMMHSVNGEAGYSAVAAQPIARRARSSGVFSARGVRGTPLFSLTATSGAIAVVWRRREQKRPLRRRGRLSMLPLDGAAHAWDLLSRSFARLGDLPHRLE